MERSADGDVLTLGLPPIVTAVPFMCVLLAGTLFVLKKKSPKKLILKGSFCCLTSLELVSKFIQRPQLDKCDCSSVFKFSGV